MAQRFKELNKNTGCFFVSDRNTKTILFFSRNRVLYTNGLFHKNYGSYCSSTESNGLAEIQRYTKSFEVS